MIREKVFNTLRACLAIDPNALDEHFVRQPQLLGDAIDNLCYAEAARDDVKMHLTITIAAEGRKLREGTERISDTAIVRELAMEPTVIEYKMALAKCENDLARWAGLVDAIKDKTKALQKLSDLTISGYLVPDAAYRRDRTEMSRLRNEKRHDTTLDAGVNPTRNRLHKASVEDV